MDTSKIIKGVVNSGRYTVTAPIVKEDYGLYLQIEGVELPETYQVDFSNSEDSGTSVTMIGNSDGVRIPRQFIDTGKDVFAFLYHVGANYGRTVYKFRIPNKVRPDRTNEEPTPEEQSVIDQAIGALNDAVAQTAQDVIDADASAQSASQSAENAHDSAVDAQNYAETAQTSANNASASAQASAQSASASANSASQAQGYAQSASASANSASGYASQADISANTASTKASEASTSAQTASQKATEASQSASQALSYKTDAESAKTASQTAQGLAESARDTAVSAKTDAESARDDAVQAKTDVQNIADGIDTRLVDVESALIDKAPIITDTASDSIASFTDGADDLPLKSLIVDINPVQDLSHGDPSPENLCPISGWTEINVNHSDADMTNPTTLTINLGQTVYGGKLDVLTGELTIDRAMVDLGTLDWRYSSTYSVFNTASLASVIASRKVVCSIYPRNPADASNSGVLNSGDKWITVNKGTGTSGAFSVGTVFLKDLAYTDAATFKTAMSGVQFVYELAEPIEIQLSANQVNSLLGVNNIWADSGDTEVEYRADTKAWIQRKIAEAIASLT